MNTAERRPAFVTLGGVGVTIDAGEVALRPQARFVLGALLRQPGRPVSIERLAQSGSKSTSTESAVAAGRVAVSRLRAALAPVGLSDIVITTPGGYALDVDPLDVDHVAFTHAVRQAEATDWPDAAMRHLDTAFSIWVDGPFGEWGADPEFALDAIALDELHRNAVDLWGELALRTGRHREALAALEAAASQEPLRERRWASLMLAHYRSMNQTEALRAFERARDALAEGVGLEPGPELRRLADEILQQDEALEWSPELGRARPADARVVPRAAVILGRETEIDDVLQLLERRRVVNLVGIGGVGKSSLAGEVSIRSGRSAWMVPLTSVRDPKRLMRVVADGVGLSTQVPDEQLLGAIADRVQAAEGLVVLDNCEHIAPAVEAFVHELLVTAPAGRVVTTTRIDLDIEGAGTFIVAPLPTGTRSDPGAAALIAADSAMIPPSRIAAEWDVIAAICLRADGIPLALELIGAAIANGASTAESIDDVIATAISTALMSLSDDARRLVEVLALLPGTASVAFLALVLDVEKSTVGRAVGEGSRLGLVVREAADNRSRIGIIEPARDLLATGTPRTSSLVGDLREVVFELAGRVRPHAVESFDTRIAGILDDEHHIVMWLLEQLPDDDQLELVTLLGPLWAACGKSAEGRAWFGRVEQLAERADPLAAARYWIARSQASPSFATRVPLVERLFSAIEVVEANGDVDLLVRAWGELSVGLLWSGRMDESAEALRAVEQHREPGNHWGRLEVVKVEAVAAAFAGDGAAAVAMLRAAATEFREIGNGRDVLSSLFLAAAAARMGGDTESLRSIVEEGNRFQLDRFSGYSYAALSYEGAQLAVAEGDPDAGPRLWEALGRLTAHGEHRTAEVCRRDLGRWRLDQGDRLGAVDVARSARNLFAWDSNAAAVALAVLATGHERSDDQRDVLATAALAQRAAPGGGPVSADEQAIIDRCGVASESTAPAPDQADVEAILRSVESRITHA